MTGHRRASAGVALATVLALGLTTPWAGAEPAEEAATYRNAVSDSFSDTFAATDDPRLGLYAGGGAALRTVASFDYLRFHQVTWPEEGG